jgi:Uma2 family endonuclease
MDESLVTGEQLYRMGDIGPSELIRGFIVHRQPAVYLHAQVEGKIAAAFDDFVRHHELGHVVTGDVGVYTRYNPDTVRAMDIAFISNQRLAQVKSKSYLDVAPELVVEVLSPDDAWSDLMEKLDEYFTCGVKVVWVADLRTRQVYVYQSVTNVERFTEKDTLTGSDVLPGFSVSIAELFASE